MQHPSTQIQSCFQQPSQGTGSPKGNITSLSLPHLGYKQITTSVLNTNITTTGKLTQQKTNTPTATTLVSPPTTTNTKTISIVVPYIHGLDEKLKRTCNKQGIQVHFKGTNTIKQLLMAPKDKDDKLQKSGVIYQYKCPQINCTEEYIGSQAGNLGTGTRNTLKDHHPSIFTPPP